jgi:hypothetical protein
MAYPISAGIEVSLDNVTFYKLTDHNRDPISLSPEIIESSQRMANGKMRKYVIAKKEKISVSWKFVPSKTSECVDGNKGAAWLESFYNSNNGVPIYVKVISSEIDPDAARGSIPSDTNFKTALQGSKTYTTFITGFTKVLDKRTKVSDYVDMTIEFTEI